MPYIGKSPANVPVTAEDIPNNSITAAKIVDNAITISDIGPNAVGNSEMADDAVGVSELSASGSPGSTTFLRGDNAWATPGVTTVNNVTGAVTAVNIRDAVESATNSHTFNDADQFPGDIWGTASGAYINAVAPSNTCNVVPPPLKLVTVPLFAAWNVCD